MMEHLCVPTQLRHLHVLDTHVFYVVWVENMHCRNFDSQAGLLRNELPTGSARLLHTVVYVVKSLRIEASTLKCNVCRAHAEADCFVSTSANFLAEGQRAAEECGEAERFWCCWVVERLMQQDRADDRCTLAEGEHAVKWTFDKSAHGLQEGIYR